MADAPPISGPEAPVPDAETLGDPSFAYIIEGGVAREIASNDAHDAPREDPSLLWVHLHGPNARCDDWLALQEDVPHTVRAALTATETRPRCAAIGEGALVNLRGIGDANMDSADPLVSIRLWLQRGRVISVVHRNMDAVAALRSRVTGGHVSDPGELVAALAAGISKHLDTIIGDVGDRLDDVEEALSSDKPDAVTLRRETNGIRGQAIAFRRFVAPEKTALAALSDLPVDWLDDHDRADLQEAANRFARMTEELEAVRERAALVGDQLNEIRARTMERRSFVLSIVALIFLPLTFFTGLLGINVEGIWFADHPQAFNGVLIVCLVTAGVLAAYFFIADWFRR